VPATILNPKFLLLWSVEPGAWSLERHWIYHLDTGIVAASDETIVVGIRQIVAGEAHVDV
jgi:hypothetical protein